MGGGRGFGVAVARGLVLAGGVALAVACGAGAHESAAMSPSDDARAGGGVNEVVARAVLGLPPPMSADERAALAETLDLLHLPEPPTAEERLAGLGLLPRSEDVRVAASEEAGSEISAADVESERDADALLIRVRGAGVDAARARCLAIVRATERALSEPDRRGVAFLEEQSRRQLARVDAMAADPAALPPDAWAPHGSNRQEALAEVRAHLLDDVDEHGLLGVLTHARDEAARDLAEMSARLGARHPDVQRKEARRRALDARLTRLQQVDHAALTDFAVRLDALPPAAEPMAVERAWLATIGAELARATLESGVSSMAPTTLRMLALEHAQLEAERAENGVAFGDRHPTMIALAVRTAHLADSFDAERARAVTSIAEYDAQLAQLPRTARGWHGASGAAAIERAARAGAVGAQRLALFEIFALLERRREELAARVEHPVEVRERCEITAR